VKSESLDPKSVSERGLVCGWVLKAESRKPRAESRKPKAEKESLAPSAERSVHLVENATSTLDHELRIETGHRAPFDALRRSRDESTRTLSGCF
jgi:hypothetical protein